MDKDIYFIRHGQTDYNKNGIVQGSGVDSDLNRMGQFQAKQFYDYYKEKIDFELVIHSSLKRTKQTIKPWIELGIESMEDHRINEMSWGDMEGKKGNADMHFIYRDLTSAWSKGDYRAGIPNGESALELSTRLNAFVNSLREMPQNKILVCSHGRALKCLICVLQGLHLREMESYKISNVGLYYARQLSGEFYIEVNNDTSHRTPLEKL